MKGSVPSGKTNGDPGALHGVIDMIVESIKKDESIGGTPEGKMKELQQETHVLNAICNTLMKDEKHNPFTIGDAKEFISEMWCEILKYAK